MLEYHRISCYYHNTPFWFTEQMPLESEGCRGEAATEATPLWDSPGLQHRVMYRTNTLIFQKCVIGLSQNCNHDLSLCMKPSNLHLNATSVQRRNACRAEQDRAEAATAGGLRGMHSVLKRDRASHRRRWGPWKPGSRTSPQHISKLPCK